MLSLLSPNRVTFNVNVFGTAATPTVRCVIGDDPGMQFPAVKLSGGDYEATIQFPPFMRAGAHQFKIEVLLNGRLFTPIMTSVDVQGPSEEDKVIAAPAVTLPSVDPKIPPAPTPVPVAVPEPAPAPEPALPRIDAEVTPREQLPEAPVKEAKAPATLDGLSKIAKKPAVKRPTAPPAPIKTVRISMLEVAQEADRREQPKTKKPEATPAKAPIVESKGIPVSFKRGDIIYR